MALFKISYWIGVLLQLIIRAPFGISTRSRLKTERRVSRTENILLSLITLASGVLPLVYSVTGWLDFADYSLPAWLGWAGIGVLALGLLIFWRAHYDLKANWSPSLELYEGHTLVSQGIYRHIRHPMYASQLVFNIAQLFLIQNWIAGPAGLLVFFAFYLLRSQAEEAMMLGRFGDQYRQYRDTTGGILPKL